ncbi:hypothetical protein GCM10010276_62680 [Streptomyces longisporus]|uniref:Uncharacterized protein n=1 Tax=Streptomyces longisporus TaxID=1948 RepID=A0ABN3MUT0_STRLO
MGFDAPAARSTPVVAVLEAQAFAVPAEVGQFGQDGRINRGGLRAAQHRHGERVEGAHPAAQPAGQHLLQLGEGPYGGLSDALDALPGGRAQPDGDGDRLVVVQEQRRQLGARAQLVATAGAGAGVDGITQLAQAVHVPAHGARSDTETVGEIGAGPLAVGLEK